MTKYTLDPAWEDVIPIPQDDGGPNPLAAIAYKEEYSEAMSYLRAVMAVNDTSERVLGLTEDIIRMNPAHYTVWLYRCKVLFALDKNLREELDWVNELALKYLKNYQIWHHRQTIVGKLGSAVGEAGFIEEMLSLDAKNYHVWSYRQWLVETFDLWNEGELDFVDKMLKQDVRNNSAWNHRWFVVYGNKGAENAKNAEIAQREIRYAEEAIALAPQNQSPWNYIRGVLKATNKPLSDVQEFAEQYARVDSPDEVRSSHALDILADIYAANGQRKEDAAKALELLALRYDPIRANYWKYRQSLLEQPSTVVA